MSTEATQEKKGYCVTKEMIKGYCDKGLTVSEMAQEMTQVSGYKCTDAIIRAAASKYKIDLRKKSKKSPFTFEEESTDSQVANTTSPELEVNQQKGFVLQ